MLLVGLMIKIIKVLYGRWKGCIIIRGVFCRLCSSVVCLCCMLNLSLRCLVWVWWFRLMGVFSVVKD